MRLALCVFAVVGACLVSQAALGAPKVSLSWATTAQSPLPAAAAPRDAGLYERCGARDLALGRVAETIVSRRIAGAPALSQHAVERVARAAGVPHPYIAVWSLAGTAETPALDPEATGERLGQWLDQKSSVGVRRCGIARGSQEDGIEVIAVVMVDALADLAPLKLRQKTMGWLRLDALVHVPADHAKVVLLGPRGRPRRVLASLSEGRIRSRFVLDQPGKWRVQVVAGLAGGPEPVLEMEIYAGIKPPVRFTDERPSAASHGVGTLLRWLNQARKKEGLPLVKRDARLDAAARAHAAAMLKAGLVAHDVGDGSPNDRVEAAGVKAARVGENVARAPTMTRVHNALWDSPSHRENMLDDSFRRVGVAVVKDEQGRLWAVQLFSD